MAWVHLFTTAPIARGIAERIESAAAESRAAGDTRTCAQLQADALAALTLTGVTPEDVMTSPVLPHPIEIQDHIVPSVQITVPALSVAGVSNTPGTLDGYGPIDPETAARIAVNAPSMTRILVQPETGTMLSVGRNQYRVPADLQRAVRLRDGTCRAPGCDRRARACDLDHFGRVGGRRDDGCRQSRLPVPTSPPDEASPRVEPRPRTGRGPRLDDTRRQTSPDQTGPRTVLTPPTKGFSWALRQAQ